MSHATIRSLIKKSFFFFVIVWFVFAYSSRTLAAGKNNILIQNEDALNNSLNSRIYKHLQKHLHFE